MPGRGLASISVDLDSLPHYCRIHGLPESILDADARELVYTRGVARFRELWASLGITGTFFAIGEDLTSAAAASVLRDAHQSGCEVGNHTWSHDYALSRRAPAEIDEEVARAEDAIEAAVGVRPEGFRAPGYTLSPALYRVLEARGYAYDSSTFPAVPYYAAKAAVMGALRAAGRPSRAILDSPRVLRAPTQPYFPDPAQPYARGQGRVLELPITTVPVTRLPFIGTFAVLFPTPVVRGVYRTLRHAPLLNFELHGIDVLGEEDGIPSALCRQQRDLRVPVATRLERLAKVFGWIAQDFDVVNLGVAARRVQASAVTA